MPTYEYRCPKGPDFDLFQSMSDEPGAVCPECGESAERLMSGGAGLIFKGEGFYITDYRSDAYKKAASSDKEATSSEKKNVRRRLCGKIQRREKLVRRGRRVCRRGRRIFRGGFEQVKGGVFGFFGRIENLPVCPFALIGLLTRFGRG